MGLLSILKILMSVCLSQIRLSVPNFCLSQIFVCPKFLEIIGGDGHGGDRHGGVGHGGTDIGGTDMGGDGQLHLYLSSNSIAGE